MLPPERPHPQTSVLSPNEAGPVEGCLCVCPGLVLALRATGPSLTQPSPGQAFPSPELSSSSPNTHSRAHTFALGPHGGTS